MSTRQSPRPLDSYPAALVYDCWGQAHRSPTVRRNGSRVSLPAPLDCPIYSEQHEEDEDDPDPDEGAVPDQRVLLLQALERSPRFTQVEIRTLHALVVEGLTLTQIARIEGCSRQAVVARLVGSNAGHGGVLRKVQAMSRFHAMLPESDN